MAKIRVIAFTVLFLFTFNSQAENSSPVVECPPSSLTVDAGRDNSGGLFGGLDLALGLKRGDLIFAGLSSYQVKSRASRSSSASRSLYIGYSFEPRGRWSFSPSYETWGARTDLMTRSLLFAVDHNLTDWSFGIQPEYKVLVWTSSDFPILKKRTNAVGGSAYMEYLGLEQWSFVFKVGSTNYGGQKFIGFLDTSYVSDSAFAQSSGLVRNFGSVAVRYYIKDWQFSLKSQRTLYLVDAASSKSFTARVNWQFSSAWGAGFEFVSSKSSDGSRTSANDLSFNFTW